MIINYKVQPTLDEEFEDGYTVGFNDGYDIAILLERDYDWILDLVKECRNYVDENEMLNYFNKKFKSIMDKRKNGVSFAFELDGEE